MRMITKEEFQSVIDQMKTMVNYQNDKNKLYKKYGADGYLVEPNANVEIIKLLSFFFGEGAKEVLSTYCIANNFAHGKNNHEYVDDDGQHINLSSPEQLYDYLLTLPDCTSNG